MIILFTTSVQIGASQTEVSGTDDLQDEKGAAAVDDIQCADTGVCVVFYHRNVFSWETVNQNGPYIKLIDIEHNFTVIGSYDFQITENSGNSFAIGLFQENETSLTILGWIREIGLYQITLDKTTNTLNIIQLNIDNKCMGDYKKMYSGEFIFNGKHKVDSIDNFTMVGQVGDSLVSGWFQITKNSCSIFDYPFHYTDGILAVNSSLKYVFQIDYSPITYTIWKQQDNLNFSQQLILEGSQLINSFIGDDLKPYLQYQDDHGQYLLNLESNDLIKINANNIYKGIHIDNSSVVHLIENSFGYKQKIYRQETMDNQTIKERYLSEIHTNYTFLIWGIYKQDIFGQYDMNGFFLLDTQSGTITYYQMNVFTDIKTTDFFWIAIPFTLFFLAIKRSRK